MFAGWEDSSNIQDTITPMVDPFQTGEEARTTGAVQQSVHTGQWTHTPPIDYTATYTDLNANQLQPGSYQKPPCYMGEETNIPSTIDFPPMETFEDRKYNVQSNGRKRTTSSYTTMDDYQDISSVGSDDDDNRHSPTQSKQRRSSQDSDPVYAAVQMGSNSNIKTERCDQSEIQLAFKEEPNANQRPSYYSEGSRGPMKGSNAKTVELEVKLQTPPVPGQTCLVIAGAAIKHNTETHKFEQHPHFKTSAVGDTGSAELTMDNLSFVAFKKILTTEDMSYDIKIENIGIKRIKCEGRTIKLERKCKVLYEAFLLKQCPYQSGSWAVCSRYQLATGLLTCEQPQGAPSVAAMTTEESCFEGGGICAARGKNLKGKNENTEVIFSSNDGAWKEKAIVHHNVTTRESVAFTIPALPREVAKGQTEVRVNLVVSVDGKDGEAREFKYKARAHRGPVTRVQQSTTWNQSSGFSDHHPLPRQQNPLSDLGDVDMLRLLSDEYMMHESQGNQDKFNPFVTQDIGTLPAGTPPPHQPSSGVWVPSEQQHFSENTISSMGSDTLDTYAHLNL